MLYASERFLIFYLVSKNITNICKKNVCFCTKYVDKERQRDDGVTQWIRRITYIFLVRYKSRWHFFTRVLIFMRSLYTWSAHSPARQQNKPHWQSRNCFFLFCSLRLSLILLSSPQICYFYVDILFMFTGVCECDWANREICLCTSTSPRVYE